MKSDKFVQILLIGAELIEVKERLSHGQFIAWVESECPFSYRTAHRYMAVARLFSKSDTVTDLTATTKSNP